MYKGLSCVTAQNKIQIKWFKKKKKERENELMAEELCL